MIKKISKTDEIRERLKNEGKLSYLDSPKHLKAINQSNEELTKMKKEYIIKDKKSQISASKVILDA